MRILDKKAFEDFISTLWIIWNSRNNAIFRGKEKDAYGIWKCALPRCCRWEKPPKGVIKVNIDAVMNSCGTSLGIIARDSDVFVLSGRASFTNKVINPEWAELDASIDGFRLAHFLNVDKVIF
ncbi:hypothetical protein Goarm_021340 [Gossypium armourianum]|uniref:RNase H type-1 domain-containing protein n=1 Tax=Gossypium armourianum TaxID=34283 RepID=A0A7J9IRB8_9ROSI|nr:hypothetical protein [Gossypium armourianum]